MSERYPPTWTHVLRFGGWFLQRCPLLKACRWNWDRGYETWWRGVVIGPVAFGVIWRTKRQSDAGLPTRGA